MDFLQNSFPANKLLKKKSKNWPTTHALAEATAHNKAHTAAARNLQVKKLFHYLRSARATKRGTENPQPPHARAVMGKHAGQV
jgi:hypothetical protein